MDGGMDTKRVFQKAIAPFHSPGCSIAFTGLPFMVLETAKKVEGSTYCVRSYFSPLWFIKLQTNSTGLKCVPS